MTIVGTVKPRGLGTFKLLIDSVSGPSSYATGGFTATVNGLTRVRNAVVVAGGGYLAEVVDVTGNQVKIKVYEFNYPATAAGPATEVASGADLSSVNFTIIALGE